VRGFLVLGEGRAEQTGPARGVQPVAEDRGALALDRWRARIRAWCAENEVPVAELRRAGQWPDEPPPASR